MPSRFNTSYSAFKCLVVTWCGFQSNHYNSQTYSTHFKLLELHKKLIKICFLHLVTTNVLLGGFAWFPMFSEISLLLKEPNTARNCLQSHFHVSLTLIFKPPYSVGNFISIYDSLMDLWGYYFTLPETRKGIVTKSPNTMWKSSKVTEYHVKKGWNKKKNPSIFDFIKGTSFKQRPQDCD